MADQGIEWEGFYGDALASAEGFTIRLMTDDQHAVEELLRDLFPPKLADGSEYH